MSMEVVNTWEQLLNAKDGVAITFTAGRSVIGPRWQVMRFVNGREILTDRSAAWYDYGHKSFSTYSGRREALTEAMRWVKEQGWYDGAWRRNRMRDYVPEAIDRAFPVRRRR